MFISLRLKEFGRKTGSLDFENSVEKWTKSAWRLVDLTSWECGLVSSSAVSVYWRVLKSVPV